MMRHAASPRHQATAQSPAAERPKTGPGAALAASPLAQLQRMADDSPQSRRMSALQASADRQVSAQSKPVQRKRNVDDTARADFERTNLRTFDVESVEQANDYYGQSLGKAGELLRDHAMPWFTGTAAPAVAAPNDTAVKAAVADATYKHFWTVGADEVTVYVGRSTALDSEEPRVVGSKSEVPDSLYIYYVNAYDVTEGRLKGINNKRTEDQSDHEDDPARPAALPNSTILWFTKIIALEKYRAANPHAATQDQVSFVSRQTIINPQTLGTMFMADEGRVAFPGEGYGGTVTLEEPTPDALAILGTPNARSTLFILKDHEEGGGAVDIRRLSFDSNDINIELMRD